MIRKINLQISNHYTKLRLFSDPFTQKLKVGANRYLTTIIKLTIKNNKTP